MSPEELASGYVVAGKYVIERVLGRGGMGAVYLVSHATTGKRMAMKCMLPQLVHDAELVSRFMREARVMGRVQHRHVVDVFDVGRDGDLLYIVMELLEGKPLSELLRDDSLTLEEALTILLRAMEGIAAAHDHGVVHRDLKPDNIFVCEGASGRLDDPRVLDFGISKLEEPTGGRLTRTGIALGTPYYMAIEQLNGQRDVDHRVDVYAMGVILYEAIAGSPPYPGETPPAIAIRMLTAPPAHLSTLRPELPAELAAVIMQAISRAREDRPGSMRELITRLRPFVSPGADLAIATGTRMPLRTPRGSSCASGQTREALPSAPSLGPAAPRSAFSVRRSSKLGIGVAITVGIGVAVGLGTYPRREAAVVAPSVPAVPRRVDVHDSAPADPESVAGLAPTPDASTDSVHDAAAPMVTAPVRSSPAPARLGAPAVRPTADAGLGASRWMSAARPKRPAPSDLVPAEPAPTQPRLPPPAAPTATTIEVLSVPSVVLDERSAKGRAGTLGASEF